MACDYPMFLDVTDRLAVIVGGGAVAARKAEKLLSAGARVRVVAPGFCDELAGRTDDRLELIAAEFDAVHLHGATLAFACTDQPLVNAQVASAARAEGVLVNRADAPDDCDFFVPAVSEHGPVRLAISTGGGSPALAKVIRAWLDEHLPVELATLAAELARLRPVVAGQIACEEERTQLWRTLCGGESMRRLANDMTGWRRWVDELIAARSG